MAATENVFLTLVCPILGVIIGTAMYCSPCKACWTVHRTQKLGVRCRQGQLRLPESQQLPSRKLANVGI
jgi:hypothetical protein